MNINYEQIGSNIANEIKDHIIKNNPNIKRKMNVDVLVRDTGHSIVFSFAVHLGEYHQAIMTVNPVVRGYQVPRYFEHMETVHHKAISFGYDASVSGIQLRKILDKLPKPSSGLELFVKIATNTLDEFNYQEIMENELKPLIIPQALDAFNDVLQHEFL